MGQNHSEKSENVIEKLCTCIMLNTQKTYICKDMTLSQPVHYVDYTVLKETTKITASHDTLVLHYISTFRNGVRFKFVTTYWATGINNNLLVDDQRAEKSYCLYRYIYIHTYITPPKNMSVCMCIHTHMSLFQLCIINPINLCFHNLFNVHR